MPLLVLSPFTRGGYVCSETFDHTSQLRFLEERFGVKAPNISNWRRKTVGDLTATLHMKGAQGGLPTLPATTDDPSYVAAKGCTETDLLEVADDQPPYPLAPASRSMPRQEPGLAGASSRAPIVPVTAWRTPLQPPEQQFFKFGLARTQRRWDS